MNRDTFTFTVYGVGEYQLGKEFQHNGAPAVVVRYEEGFSSEPRTTVTAIYGRYDGALLVGLTCEQLEQATGRDSHMWRDYTSLHDDYHYEACTRCGTVRKTNRKVTEFERAQAQAEYDAAVMSLESRGLW
jgi:hypothetical protein